MKIYSAVLLCAIPIAALAQPVDPLDAMSNLNFHAKNVDSPWSLLESAAYAGIFQGLDTPREWGQGGTPTGNVLPLPLAPRRSVASLLLVWIRRSTRTRDISDRATLVFGAGRPMRFAEPH